MEILVWGHVYLNQAVGIAKVIFNQACLQKETWFLGFRIGNCNK